MNYLNEPERAARTAPILLEIIERPAAFSELFVRYREADGPINNDFLQRLPQARDLWRRANEPEAATEILQLPLAFREAVLHGLFRDRRADTLQKCLDLAVDRATKKSLKRLLYELRKLGVTPPVTRRSILSPKVAAENAPFPCYVASLEYRNDRLLFTAAPAPSGLHVLHTVDGGDVVVRHHYEETSRKNARRYIDDLRKVDQMTLFEIDLGFASYMLHRVVELARQAGHELPTGLIHAISEMKLEAYVPARHPYYELVDGQAVFDRLIQLSDSDLLHNENEFASWTLDDEALRGLQLTIDELETSRLLLDEAQKREQLRHRLERAVDQFFDRRRRLIFAERLRDAAFLLARRGAAVQAQTAVALAMRLENPQVAPSSVPFFLHMVTKLLSLPPEQKEKDQPPSGLILP